MEGTLKFLHFYYNDYYFKRLRQNASQWTFDSRLYTFDFRLIQ